MRSRLKASREILKQKHLDALIVSSGPNISYLTGRTSHDAYLLVTLKDCFYLTDSRYIDAARSALPKEFSLKKIQDSALELIADICNVKNLKRIGFQESDILYSVHRDLNKRLKKSRKLLAAGGLIEDLREIKDGQEAAKIKKGIRIIAEAFNFVRRFIKPGQKEIEIAAELERFIRYRGAQGPAFNIIVAAGNNSAYPHHASGERKIKKGEPVLIDIGVECDGYKSDITRVFPVGKPDKRLDKIYDIVLKAQAEALILVKPGAKIKDIDAAARQYIEKRGHGSNFVHSLGHGVGLEVHERPRLSAKSEDVLKPGMVFTLEPAIYLRGKFGVRIEDMVLVTNKGYQLLSKNIPKRY